MCLTLVAGCLYYVGGTVPLVSALAPSETFTVPNEALLGARGHSRVLFWASAVSGLNRLQLAEKKKILYLPPVGYMSVY